MGGPFLKIPTVQSSQLIDWKIVRVLLIWMWPVGPFRWAIVKKKKKKPEVKTNAISALRKKNCHGYKSPELSESLSRRQEEDRSFLCLNYSPITRAQMYHVLGPGCSSWIKQHFRLSGGLHVYVKCGALDCFAETVGNLALIIAKLVCRTLFF